MNDISDPRVTTLRRAIEHHQEIKGTLTGGLSAIAGELGCSPALLWLLLQGTYTGAAERWLNRAEKMYGAAVIVHCPVLGDVDGLTCSRYQLKIKHLRKNGAKGGNSQTTRLIRECPCEEGI